MMVIYDPDYDFYWVKCRCGQSSHGYGNRKDALKWRETHRKKHIKSLGGDQLGHAIDCDKSIGCTCGTRTIEYPQQEQG